jgi:predicted Zn-dependent peptidase
MRAGLLTVAALAAMLAPLAAYGDPSGMTTGTLPRGGSYTMSPDATVPQAALSLWFRAPADGYDGKTPGIARLSATAAASSTLASGKTLVAMIRQVGGTLAIDVYPDMVNISADVPAASARRVLAGMTEAYFAPHLTDDALKVARTDAAVLSAQQRYFADDIVHNELFAQIFSAGPAHEAPIPTTLDQIKILTLGELSTFAARAFRSANATLALAGNVDPSLISAVTDGTPGRPDAPIASTLAPAPQDRTIDAAVPGAGIGWVGPAIADERAATAMDFIADYLFRQQTGVVTKAIDPTGDNYVTGQFITLHDPGVMLVTIGGEKPQPIETRVLAAVQALQKPLAPAAFAAAREAFLYHLAADAQTPDEQASNLGWYATEGNATYAPSSEQSAYWKAARSLDAAYVASVAQKYLAHPVVVHLLTTTASKDSAS